MFEINRKLIRKCIRGNRKSQKTIYQGLYNSIFKTCMIYSDSKQHADEYIHRGFLKIFNNLKNFNHDLETFNFWSINIVRNLIIDDLRKNQRLDYCLDKKNINESVLIDDVLIDDSKIHTMDTLELMSIIQQLSDRNRVIFGLKVLDNMSHVDIAKILSIKESTSKIIFQKAKLEIKEMLV